LDISPQADFEAVSRAAAQGVRVETFLERQIEADLRSGASSAKLFIVRILRWWAKPVVTAALVLLLLNAADQVTLAYDENRILLAALHWFRVAFISLFPWPFTVLVAASVVFASPYSFANVIEVIGTFRKIKIAGAEIELNERTKSKLLTAASEIQAAIKEYRNRADREVSRLVSRYQIASRLTRFSDEIIIGTYSRQPGYRCTIHIPDPIADDRLYQLLNYHPTGEGAFRTFSDRYGIIGKVWRTERSLVFNNVADLPATASAEDKLKAVMAGWGMDRRQAEHALTRPSAICLLLEHRGEKVGILYIDSNKLHAFPGTGEPELANLGARANSALAETLDEVIDDLSSLKLKLDIELGK
jgi:hypothetical protein